MKSPSGIVFAGIFLMTLTSCASTPAVPVPSGSRVVVRLYDARSGFELALANESHPDYQDVYSHARPDASLKLAPDDLIGQLLASLDRAGFGLYARPGPLQPGFTSGWLSIDRDGQQSVFEEPPHTAGADIRRSFGKMKLLMDLYYRSVGSLQFIANPAGDNIFGDGP